jgi:predicted dehydrogenase
VRQGTGPFIAAGLAQAGAQVVGVVGTSAQTTSEAVMTLNRDWNLRTRGYTDLGVALAQTTPDAVAICSPWRYHAQQLQQVAQAGCHCLVEKPVAWPASAADMTELLNGFGSRSLLLQQVAQWPTTLPAFAQLHGELPARIDSFTLRLSPISIGEDMLTDSAPHFISLLQALVGPGDCLGVTLDHSGEQLALICGYQHATGMVNATLLLQTCAQRPRPAWYQINHLRADRQVQLPEYTQALVCGGRSAAIKDPMQQVTARFIADLKAGKATDSEQLLGAHRNLLQLAAGWR